MCKGVLAGEGAPLPCTPPLYGEAVPVHPPCPPPATERHSLCAPLTWYRETFPVCPPPPGTERQSLCAPPPTWCRNTVPVCPPPTWHRETCLSALNPVHRDRLCAPHPWYRDTVPVCPPPTRYRESPCAPLHTSPCTEREFLPAPTAPPHLVQRQFRCAPHTGRQSCVPLPPSPIQGGSPCVPPPLPPTGARLRGLCACCTTVGRSPALCCGLAAPSACNCKGSRPPGQPRPLACKQERRGTDPLWEPPGCVHSPGDSLACPTAPCPAPAALQGAGLWLSLGRGDGFSGPSLHHVLGPQARDTASGATPPRMYKMYIGNIYMDAL
ncbi:unnamed protein product [Natator depressus]